MLDLYPHELLCLNPNSDTPLKGVCVIRCQDRCTPSHVNIAAVTSSQCLVNPRGAMRGGW